MSYPGGVRDLETVLVLDDVVQNEFPCYSCRRSLKPQKTLVHVDRMAGKERRTGAYCVKCAYQVMVDKVDNKEGGKDVLDMVRVLAVGASLQDGEIYVIPDA